MTPPPPPPSAVPTLDSSAIDATTDPTAAVDQISHHLLPHLLSASLTPRHLLSRWLSLHSLLSQISAALSSLPSSPPFHPLFLHLLPSLLSSLLSLLPLSSLCLLPNLPPSKLQLQSDLDCSISSLSLLLHHLSLLASSNLPNSSALILPLPPPSAPRPDLSLFVRDSFARLQIGTLDIKLTALDSLLQLLSSDPPKISRVVAEDGDLPALIRMIDSSTTNVDSVIRDRAVAVVSILATECELSRKAVFEEGALGPLLRLLDAVGSSAAVKEKAAAAVFAITGDSGSGWALAAYGGVSILVGNCWSGSGSAAVQAFAAGSLKNVVGNDDIRAAMVEEGAVAALADLLVSGNVDAQKNSALCLATMASMGGDEIRAEILKENGLQRLLELLGHVVDAETSEYALKAIEALSSFPAAAKHLSVSLIFFSQLTDLIQRGNAGVRLLAASLVSKLAPGEEIKRLMAGCMAMLVKMMECPKPASMQEASAGALVSLLAVKSNRKEFSKDEKSLSRLVQMLDPKNEVVGKKHPVAVLLALTTGSSGARKRVIELGALSFLETLVDDEVPGAKKALQRISGGRLKNLFTWPL